MGIEWGMIFKIMNMKTGEEKLIKRIEDEIECLNKFSMKTHTVRDCTAIQFAKSILNDILTEHRKDTACDKDNVAICDACGDKMPLSQYRSISDKEDVLNICGVCGKSAHLNGFEKGEEG